MLFCSKPAKYGRRSSVSKEIIENLSKNIEITSSDYLVPKLNEQFDLAEVILGESCPHNNLMHQYYSHEQNIKHKSKNDKKLEESKMG